MTLQNYTDSLPIDKQFELAIRFIKLAMPIWDKYAGNNSLTYRDTVVGLVHSVDRNLLKNTIEAIENHISTNKVNNLLVKNSDILSSSRQFIDPIVALQDTDWELPYEVEKIFYAVHNLLEASVGNTKTVFDESTIYVAINQAIDALNRSGIVTDLEIKNILNDYKNGK